MSEMSILLAKTNPEHQLLHHCLDVAAVSSYLMPKNPPIPKRWILLFIALHDLGKADTRFQDYIKNVQSGPAPLRHEIVSKRLILTYLKELSWDAKVTRTIAQSISMHHSKWFENSFNPKLDIDYHEFIDELLDIFRIQPKNTPVININHCSNFGVFLSGLLVMSDWVASNTNLYNYTLFDTTLSPKEYWSNAKKLAKKAVRRLKLKSNRVDPLSYEQIFNNPNYSLTPIQKEVETRVNTVGINPGLTILEAPTGEGKTEAAIYLSEYWRSKFNYSGMYIALPTQATSNQIYHRYRTFLKNNSIKNTTKLIHGMSWVVDNIFDKTIKRYSYLEDYAQWFQSSRRALLSPEGVGTIDQVLLSVLNVKFGFLRLYGLINKVLILDEIHACDEYMTTILERLLEWCSSLKIPVILLSATLSDRQRNRLVKAYGLNEYGESANVIKTPFYPTEMKLHYGYYPNIFNPETECEKIAELTNQIKQGCTCVIMNTVKTAQLVYKNLKRMGVDNLYLFHSRYPASRRNEIEKEVVSLFGKDGNRPENAVVVATQVIEQSLDVDFDTMISELAPIDLLIQRAGRLHRHNRPRINKKELHVLTLRRDHYDSINSIYSKEILIRTAKLLEDIPVVQNPNYIPEVINTCYPLTEDNCNLQATEDYADSKANKFIVPKPEKDGYSLIKLTSYKLEAEGSDKGYIFASTRLEESTTSIILVEDESLLEILKQEQRPNKQTMKQIYLSKTNIPISWLEKEEITIKSPEWLPHDTIVPVGSYNIIYDKFIGLEKVKDEPKQ